MKRTNLLRKSINLALSILVAGSIVAVGTDGTTLASIFGNNDAIITSVVDAAEVAQIPWSTAYVYGLLPIDLSTGGHGQAADGSSANVSYWAGADQSWIASFFTATTADKQTLQFQFMTPNGLFPLGGQGQDFYMFNDAAKQFILAVDKEQLKLHKHLWEYTQPELATEYTNGETYNVGAAWYDAVDEGLYYRITCSYNEVYTDGYEPTTGMMTLVEVKATGEVYGFFYTEPSTVYNDIRAKEIIYSCIPTKLQ